MNCPHCDEPFEVVEKIEPLHRDANSELRAGDQIICRGCRVVSVINPGETALHPMTRHEFDARGPSTRAKLYKARACLLEVVGTRWSARLKRRVPKPSKV